MSKFDDAAIPLCRFCKGEIRTVWTNECDSCAALASRVRTIRTDLLRAIIQQNGYEGVVLGKRAEEWQDDA